MMAVSRAIWTTSSTGWPGGSISSSAISSGYPRTDWLIKRGARNEQVYKRLLRRHQLPTDVWYNAYPGLSVVDLERNTRIRKGIERRAITDTEAREWLSLL